MKNNQKCPECGKAILIVRTSKRVGTLVEQRRECRSRKDGLCDYHERVMIRPAEIISVHLLSGQQAVPHQPTDLP